MKNVRRGLGKGLGSGYKNIVPIDAHIHSLSAKGKKTYAVPVKGLLFTKARDEKQAEKKVDTLLNDRDYQSGYKSCIPIQYGALNIGRDREYPEYTDELGKEFFEATELTTLEAKGEKVTCSGCGNVYDWGDIDARHQHLTCIANKKLNAKFSMYGQKWTVVDKNKRTVLLKTKKGDTLTITRDEYEQYKPKRYSVQEMIESVVNAKGKKSKNKHNNTHQSGDDRANYVFESDLFAKGKCDVVSHLKHSKLPDSKFDKVQLKKGMGVETEHTTSKKVAKAIAKAHLLENPNYYKKFNPKKKTKDFLMNAKGKAKYKTLLNRASRVTLHTDWKNLNYNEKKYIRAGVDRMLANDYSQGGYGGKFKKYILEGGHIPSKIK